MKQKKNREVYEWEEIIDMYKKSNESFSQENKKLKRELRIAQTENRRLNRILKKAGKELLEKQIEVEMNCRNTEI